MVERAVGCIYEKCDEGEVIQGADVRVAKGEGVKVAEEGGVEPKLVFKGSSNYRATTIVLNRILCGRAATQHTAVRAHIALLPSPVGAPSVPHRSKYR